ncbi:MAG: XRE family transcriptional regulator, partial [Hyphomicrobiales bacterium]
KQNIGSSLDDFLQEEAILEEVTAVALKRVIAWQIAEEMKAQQLTKAQLATRMHTSRAALNRLLDENDPGLTLTTLASAAAALGRRVDIRLAPPHQTTKAVKVKKNKPAAKKPVKTVEAARPRRGKLSAALLQPDIVGKDLDSRNPDTGRNVEL